MSEMRHKNKKQENFPVGSFFIHKDLREVVWEYYKFARYADDIADNPKLEPQTKIEKLRELEDIFLGTKEYHGQKLKFAKNLKKHFEKHQLSPCLATDLLIAFRQDSMGFEFEIWEQLIKYCTYSAAPVGRFMLALHKESISTYLPATSLCVALQIVNHIQDIKYDAKVLNRIYIPTQYLKKYKLEKNDLLQDESPPELKKIIDLLLSRVEGLLVEANLTTKLVKNFGIKIEICVIVSLTNIMIKKLKKGDVLAKEIKLSKLDWVRAFASGIWKAIR